MNPTEIGVAIAEQCLCFRARRTSRAITRLYDDALRPMDLQASQLTLLSAIAAAGDDGQRLNKLAEVLATDATTLSRNLRPLQTRELLAIDRLVSDRRIRLIRLTREGEQVLAEALSRWREANLKLLHALGPEAAADLRSGLDNAAAIAMTEHARSA